MTATETPAPERTSAVAAPPLRRMLIFGTGLGIAVGAREMEVAIVRSRASGATLAGATVIRDFRARPAAEWGSELLQFLAAAGEPNLTASVLLPRGEVIVRIVALPGVADKDIPAAVGLQVETLHPWGDEEVAWAWTRADRDKVLVGLVRKASLESYETLFSEAGIGLAAVTFSSAVIHAALRIWSAAPASLLCYTTGGYATGGDDRVEIYGESEARPVYSAEMTLTPERALAVSRAELRLDADYPACALAEALPKPAGNIDYSALAYAAALAASAPLVARFANLLPAERRASNVRKQFLLPAVLGALALIALVVGLVVLPALANRRYLAALKAETHSLAPLALRAQTLQKNIDADRAKVALLDDFRRRPQADLDVLNELTRILPAEVWTNTVEIYPDSVVLSGEADQAAPLLKLLDSSPLFQNSDFALAVAHSASGPGEQFRIKTMRRGRIGRSTP